MADKWNVRVTTKDDEQREFQALTTFELTPQQKLLWETAQGEQKQITVGRVKAVIEWKGDNVRVHAAEG